MYQGRSDLTVLKAARRWLKRFCKQGYSTNFRCPYSFFMGIICVKINNNNKVIFYIYINILLFYKQRYFVRS